MNEEIFLKSPVQVSWGSTNACNLNCIHCRANASSEKPNELGTEEVKSLIETLSDMDVFYFEISGGEPLLRKDFFDIVEFAHRKGLEVLLSSNGSFINKENAKKLKEKGIKKIQISLDGGYPRTHDNFRGKEGSFNDAIKAIENLVNEGVYVVVSSILTKKNRNEVEKIINIVAEKGALEWRGLTLLPCGRGNDIFAEIGLSLEELRKIEEKCQSKKRELKRDIDLGVEKCFNLGEKIPSEDLNYSKAEASCFGCGAGISEIYIDPTGNVYPCNKMTDEKFFVGNVRKNNFKQLWKNSSILEKFRNHRQNIKGKCRECKLSDYCKGGCKAVSWNLKKDAFIPDPRCPFNKKDNPELFENVQ